MSQTPKPFGDRLPSIIKEAANAVRLHAQQIVQIQTNVAVLQPGDWQDLTLDSGWTDIPGFTPPLVRIQGGGLALLVGHVQGGDTSDGTVIGTVGSGYFNPSHSHAFTANVLAGAGSVYVNGSVSGSSDSAGLFDGTTQGSSGSASGSGTHSHGPGSYSVTNGHHQHTSSALLPQTPISYNTPTLTMNTSGQLVLTNCSSSATQLSFSESLPLVTA